MARRGGGQKRLKRLAAPKHFPFFRRKGITWAIKPSPGPHRAKECIPLAMIVRELLGYAQNLREARKIISKGLVLVDGRPRKDYKYPVGFMDTISIPKTNEHFRVLIDRKGKFKLVKISEEEAKYKLTRIENKTMVKGGKIQLNCIDGINLLADNSYKTGDTIKITLPEKKIVGHLPFKEGNLAFVIGGKHVGKVGKIVEIKKGSLTRRSEVILESDGERFTTPKRYVFVIGTEKPEVTLA